MKSLLLLLATAFVFSLAGCSTAPKKDHCASGDKCCADTKPAHKR